MIHYLLAICALAGGTLEPLSAAVPPTAKPAATTTISQPITLEKQTNVVLEALRITNGTGNGITLKNCKNVRVVNCWIGPCSGEGINIQTCDHVTIASNRFEKVRSGIYALSSQSIVITYNRCLNVQGPMPRGQFAQFDKVTGSGNQINFNLCQNVLGQSHPEDVINLYKSSGTPESPIEVIGNWIRGGGPSASGGGIMNGDDGGGYVRVADNLLVDPGQYGIAIAGGDHIEVIGNKIFAKQQPFCNVGLYVWNQYAPPCSNHSVRNNQVRWFNRDGKENPCWNANNCGTVEGWVENDWHADLRDTLLPTNLWTEPR